MSVKTTIKYIAPWLAAAAMAGAIGLALVASAATTTHTDPDSGASPLVPYGTNSNSVLPYDDGGNVYEHAGAV